MKEIKDMREELAKMMKESSKPSVAFSNKGQINQENTDG